MTTEESPLTANAALADAVAALRGVELPVTTPTPRAAWAESATAERDNGDLTLPDRMFEVVYRAARGAGCSRRSSRRLCLRVLRTLDNRDNQDTRRTGAAPVRDDTGRRTRTRLLTALRAELGSRADRPALERACTAAILADELALLPPRQQAALRWVVTQRWTVRQVSERTGWSPQQVARLLQAGLTTLTVCGHLSRG